MNLGTEYNNNEQQIVQILFWTTNEPLKVQYTHSEKKAFPAYHHSS